MSITDELRKVAAKTECANGRCEKLYRGDLERIADRIDAEHESACGEAYSNGMKSIWLPNPTEYIRLPVDADGEYIHIGDVMESRTGSDLFPQFEVRAMRYDGDWWEVIDRLGDRYEPSGLRHYHAPTVEDVLEEFANRLYEKAAYFDEEHVQKAITEYASKLRLAGDDE